MQKDYIPTNQREFDTGFSIVENKVIESMAFCRLGGTAAKIYLLLRTKARLPTSGERRKLRKLGLACPMAITNNGNLELTYKEIQARLKVSKPTISAAFKELEAVGLVDVALAGSVYRKSLYALSKRWMHYGTPKFEKVTVKRIVSQAGVKSLKAIHATASSHK